MTRTRVTLPREFPGGIRYDREEQQAVLRVVASRSPFRFYGPDCQFETDRFEEEFGRFLASSPGSSWPARSPFLVTAVNSGTGALEIALEALGVGCGDEVLVPGFMWISTISSIVRNRAIPVLADADETLNIDPDEIGRKVSNRTRAVLVVHMAGEPARIGPIMDQVRRINTGRLAAGLPPLRVVEDCAQAIGGHARGIPGTVDGNGPDGTHRLGCFGDIGIFSLQLNKNITSGEGGIVVTRDPGLHSRIRALHDVGFLRDSRGTGNVEGCEGQTLAWGQGRRFTEVQAALARVQLSRLDHILASMRHAHRRLESFITTLPDLEARFHADDTGGDSGGFLLFGYRPPPGGETQTIALGRRLAADLRDRGLPAFYLHDYEVHIYYNIVQLVERQPLDAGGCPWSCRQREDTPIPDYGRGALPRLDSRLVRTVGICIASTLGQEDLQTIGSILAEVHAELIVPALQQ